MSQSTITTYQGHCYSYVSCMCPLAEPALVQTLHTITSLYSVMSPKCTLEEAWMGWGAGLNVSNSSDISIRSFSGNKQNIIMHCCRLVFFSPSPHTTPLCTFCMFLITSDNCSNSTTSAMSSRGPYPTQTDPNQFLTKPDMLFFFQEKIWPETDPMTFWTQTHSGLGLDLEFSEPSEPVNHRIFHHDSSLKGSYLFHSNGFLVCYMCI